MKLLQPILLAVVLVLPATIPLVAQQSAPVQVIKMTAKKYRFSPNTITVKQGQRVKLMITALDATHGFAIKAYGVNQKLPKGKPVAVEFTANKAGTFEFRCSVFCGIGHRKMRGKLVVVPANGAAGS